MSVVKSHTPLEAYTLAGNKLWVKREDLCIDGPSFSKLRGVEAHLRTRPEKWIGVLDTFHSKAGWGVSLLCKQLGKRAVVFYPKYKGETGLREYQQKAKELGASLIPFPAGRSAILYHYAKREMAEIPDSYLLPNALKLRESIEETAKEVAELPRKCFEDTAWVVSVSSGTIGAGVLKGLLAQRPSNGLLVLHMGYSRSKGSLLRYVYASAGADLQREELPVAVIDEGYAYKDKVEGFEAPFPCNEYYDLKAWKWLERGGISQLRQSFARVLFWNIGA